MNDKLEQALYKIDFFERVKTLSERYISDGTEFMYDVDRTLEILAGQGYKALYDKKEKFFKIIDELGAYKVAFHISVEDGYLDAGWYLYKKNNLISGDVWQMLSIDFDDRYEDKMKPMFSSYEEMREILREALRLYIFFNKGEDYWKQGSGDSCFEVEGCEEWLIFFYDESYGFMLIRHPEYLVTIDRSVNIETVEHYIGGEPMSLPTCSYVSRESAYKIAQEFIVTGKFSEMVEWIDLYDIEFEHDFY